MRRSLVLGAVLVGLVLAGAAVNANTTWLATGSVTKVDDTTFYLLAGDNTVYEIDGSRAKVLAGESETQCCSFVVGDRVRVYGIATEPEKVEAEKIRVIDHNGRAVLADTNSTEQGGKEVRIIIAAPGSAGAGSSAQPPVQREEINWRSRGLITSINYTGRQINIQTPAGNYTINVAGARLYNANTRIGLGTLSQGDAVRVEGSISGLNEIDAQVVTVLRSRSQAEAALPLLPVSVVGVITQVDYASFTFKMRTETLSIVVMADQDTLIQEYHTRMAFMDLRPGMSVKMSGYGSPGTGYAAQHIMIIGTAP